MKFSTLLYLLIAYCAIVATILGYFIYQNKRLQNKFEKLVITKMPYQKSDVEHKIAPSSENFFEYPLNFSLCFIEREKTCSVEHQSIFGAHLFYIEKNSVLVPLNKQVDIKVWAPLNGAQITQIDDVLFIEYGGVTIDDLQRVSQSHLIKKIIALAPGNLYKTSALNSFAEKYHLEARYLTESVQVFGHIHDLHNVNHLDCGCTAILINSNQGFRLEETSKSSLGNFEEVKIQTRSVPPSAPSDNLEKDFKADLNSYPENTIYPALSTPIEHQKGIFSIFNKNKQPITNLIFNPFENRGIVH